METSSGRVDGPCKSYSEVIADLVKNGDTDWFGGEAHLTPDEVEIGPRDEGAITALANAYGKDPEQVRKDVVHAAELEVDSVIEDERIKSGAIAAIIARAEADDFDG